MINRYIGHGVYVGVENETVKLTVAKGVNVRDLSISFEAARSLVVYLQQCIERGFTESKEADE